MGKERSLSAFERAVAQAVGDGRQLGNDADPLRERCPLLWGWLSVTIVGKDLVKTPAVLTIRLGPGGALASLVDRDLCCTVEASAGTVEGVLLALEAALASPAPPLKNWGKREPRLRRRRSS